MSLKSWLVGRVVDHEIDELKKEGKMSALWRVLDGRKRLLGGALSALTLLATFLTQLTPIAVTSLGKEAKPALYLAGGVAFLTWLSGVLHGAWKLYYGEEHQD